MALNMQTKASCAKIALRLRPVTAATTAVVTILSVSSGGSTTHNVTFSGGTTTLQINTSALAASTGVFMISVTEAGMVTPVVSKALLIHCDIDCCLAKLTNELLACECDCPRCSSALAKAQKIYLLLQSAIAKVEEINSHPNGSTVMGEYDDIADKYKKAKELCDGSCGCEC